MPEYSELGEILTGFHHILTRHLTALGDAAGREAQRQVAIDILALSVRKRMHQNSERAANSVIQLQWHQ